jgi:type II secretory pathway component HofQ
MNRNRTLVLSAALLAFLTGGTAFAQGLPPQPVPSQPPQSFSPQASSQAATTSVKVQVVLARYEGDRRLSSQPYTLTLVPGQSGNIRTGAEVAVPTTTAPGGATSYTMQQLGTQIDATVNPAADGKFRLILNVTDRSMVTGAQASQIGGGVPNVPTFRNNSSASQAIMASGETIQFTTVVDKVTNETFRIDVTLTVGNK